MKAVFLPGAEEDLKELRRYIIKSFGKSAWQDTWQKIKDSVRSVETFPQNGSVPEELSDLGLGQYRQAISGMNRIIYEIREEIVFIHVVCDTRRQMMTLLSRRLLRVVH